jgi:hypothetical protein
VAIGKKVAGTLPLYEPDNAPTAVFAGDFVAQVRGHLIVSCQALPDEPLYGAEIMARMAVAAQRGGARAIRANTPVDIAAIRAAVNPTARPRPQPGALADFIAAIHGKLAAWCWRTSPRRTKRWPPRQPAPI